MDPPRKVAFYIRVSTERQARVEEGSLKNQEQMLRTELERRNAQRPGWGAFVESYVDEGISAKTTNRPAFQRLMRDIELGKIDTVLFTELSRLSRSLKDFLNIFEFAQRHACDLVCLKTEIDTTSPYQGLVTKILMVFSEFEREMTSRRTALNAYERSKRGLANGGFTVLGYRRDAQHKGRLLVDEQEAEVVRAIFQTYVQECSIRRTTAQIKARYQGRFPKLKGICPNTVYRVLLNKAYLGIRAIHKRDKANYEEVSAAWEPIVEESLFGQVQALLQANKHRYHRLGPERYTYLLSGLIRCGTCGKKLQGTSSYASSGKRHRYYSHRTTCFFVCFLTQSTLLRLRSGVTFTISSLKTSSDGEGRKSPITLMSPSGSAMYFFGFFMDFLLLPKEGEDEVSVGQRQQEPLVHILRE
jgi:site-specific DNA recombinase